MQDLANEIAAAKGGDSYVFQSGAIVVEGTELSAQEIFDAAVAAAQRKARALFGTTARAAETLNV